MSGINTKQFNKPAVTTTAPSETTTPYVSGLLRADKTWSQMHHSNPSGERGREGGREKQRETETSRQTDRQRGARCTTATPPVREVGRVGERNRERQRQADRQTDNDRNTEAERLRDREWRETCPGFKQASNSLRDRDRDKNRNRQRQTHRHTHTETHTQKGGAGGEPGVRGRGCPV